MLSIVVVTRNEERCLPRLLESLRYQRVEREVIVADNSSDDATRKIARRYGARVVDGGIPAVGRNRGARAARGDLLLFLDADVAFAPGELDRLVVGAGRRRLDVATCRYVPLSSRLDDRLIYAFYNAWAALTVRIHPIASGFCILVRRPLYKRLGGFDESIRLANDFNFTQRAARRGRFGIVREARLLSDVRRLESEGRFGLLRKYVHGYVHRIVRGEMHRPPFEYVLHGGFDTRR